MAERPRTRLKLPIFPRTILVDSREQLGWTFQGIVPDAKDGGPESGSMIIALKMAYLPTGDYTLEGFESSITLERKSRDDLWSTISTDRERFARELERMASFEVAHVIVEAEWSDLWSYRHPFSDFKVKGIHRAVISWQQKFPTVQWSFCPGRTFAERHAFRILQRFYRQWEAKQKLQLKGEGATNNGTQEERSIVGAGGTSTPRSPGS